MKVATTLEIAAPPRDVCALFADFGRAAEHIDAVAASNLLTAEPVRRGTRFRQTRRNGDREMTFEFDVVAWDPPDSFEIENETGGFLWHSRYTFVPRGSRTSVTLEMTARPRRLVAWLMLPLLHLNRSKMKAMMAADLHDLERAAEARAV